MKTILFVTSNERKIGEARLACDQYDIKVKQIKLSIDEIQSNDPKLISKHKAQSAYLAIKKPLVVTDTYWNIPALNGFPGGYMKDITKWFEPQDFLNLVKNKTDKRIAFGESITYIDSKQLKTFSKEFWGVFADKPRGIGNSIEQVAEFDGFTLGERREQGGFSHKPEDYVWVDFAKWLTKI
ncbi:MAG: Nucleoside-triphosphatase (NTPase) [Candidatus Woesebacteria bacterium GW2011_GWB1_38_5b]|uniref:Nucleoside-triphosphatase (NTPase) n=1 Tax=Candidatus Woesebacteria bacterium GW2011_GWB1_38_5b TaxID=1618569 RepID=A0A0G0NE46_9BACT|nr:MAG: Nucleoside-triphosphatase (NTPase) [Candidatus Woesebacteria bacterium GW2011_GWB1_38_5b]